MARRKTAKRHVDQTLNKPKRSPPEGTAFSRGLASTPPCLQVRFEFQFFLESLKLSFWAFPWEWSLFFGKHNLNRGRRLGDLAPICVPLGLMELWCCLVKRVNSVLCPVKYQVSLHFLEQRLGCCLSRDTKTL